MTRSMSQADRDQPKHVSADRVSLPELIERRQKLQVALATHDASLREFWPPGRPYFVIQTAELANLGADDPSTRPRHLTSSASCFESLADAHPGLDGHLPAPDKHGIPPWRDQAQEYSRRALLAPPGEWTSDDAAHVYCRVRALPAIVRYAPLTAPESAGAVGARGRLEEAFSVIDRARPLVEQGLGERALDDEGAPRPEPPDRRYPPNTFHAYWGLKAHRRYQERRDLDGALPELSAEHDERVRQNQAWAHAAIGRHTALLNGKKRRGDAQQLAFAVLTDLLTHGRELTPASAQYDLYEAAVATFFAAQEPEGDWPRSLPLFHYPISGNAYCYTFETLTELLRPALPREAGRTYRSLLEPYLPQLFQAWDYAMRTRVPLNDQRGNTHGWSSAHHIARESPEAWATAEVFSFGQMLRCMTGHVVAERAAAELRARRPDYPARDTAAIELGERGDTWAEDGWTVGRQLAGLFLHPASAPRDQPVDVTIRDPDAAVLGPDHARSAVLFGPPGTGKTTLVEALAGALGWQYVEVLASDFLREGVDGVPAQADRIFDLLMQLDRCVVLFDEIDELIQDRRSEASDPFGRFLTTSMLPKIAKLWKQRRVVFFVATNHVSRADPAITRTSRFDARIFVAPPGLAVKRRELTKALEGEAPAFHDATVTQALSSNKQTREELNQTERALGVLPLLRYDQVPELVRRLRRSGEPAKAANLASALDEMRKDLLHHEWQAAAPPDKWDERSPEDQLRFVLHEYREDESRDFARRRIGRLELGADQELPVDWPVLGEVYRSGGQRSIYVEAPEDLSEMLQQDGDLRIGGGDGLFDGGLLLFRYAQSEGGRKADEPVLSDGAAVSVTEDGSEPGPEGEPA